MKRYLLFMGDDNFPTGGWGDFFSSFESPEAALVVVGEKTPDWWEVVDGNVGRVVIDSTFKEVSPSEKV
jgi:hypothetical protein